MGDLDDVLDLLKATTPRWATLRAEGREWRHTGRGFAAFESHIASQQAKYGRGSVVALTGYSKIGDESPPPEETDERWRVWMERGWRKRAQFAIGDEDVTVVFDGPTWWNWSPSRGGMTNGGRENFGHGAGPSEVLIHTSPLLSALQLDVLEADTVAGRAAFVVRGVPLEDDGAASPGILNGLGLGADDYLLTVDAERGVLLRTEARRRGQPFQVIEATAVEFDVDLPADTFTIELAHGETFGDAWSEVRWRKRRKRWLVHSPWQRR